MTNRLQICLVASSVPPKAGGVEVFLGTHVQRLADRGATVHLLCGNEPASWLSDTVRRSGGTLDVVDDTAPPDAMPWEYYTFERAERIFRLLDATGCRIVHAASHDVAVASAIAKNALPELALVTAFGEMATDTTGFGLARSRFVHDLAQIDMFVAWSAYYVSRLREYEVPEARIRVVYAGVDTELFACGDRRRGRRLLQRHDEEFVICCPSRFSPRKGQLDLVEAMVLIADELPPFHLVLTGSVHSGSVAYLQEVKSRLAATGLTPRTTFALDTPFEDLPDIVKASDLVVQPSHREGLGGAALEAMAADRCVLLTQTTGFDEIAKDGRTAVFAQPECPESLAGQIGRLAHDGDLRAAIGVRAGAHARAHFDATHASDRLLAVYREVHEHNIRNHTQPPPKERKRHG